MQIFIQTKMNTVHPWANSDLLLEKIFGIPFHRINIIIKKIFGSRDAAVFFESPQTQSLRRRQSSLTRIILWLQKLQDQVIFQNRFGRADDYELHKKLGKGRYSEVFKGYNILNYDEVVIKLLKPSITFFSLISQNA